MASLGHNQFIYSLTHQCFDNAHRHTLMSGNLFIVIYYFRIASCLTQQINILNSQKGFATRVTFLYGYNKYLSPNRK